MLSFGNSLDNHYKTHFLNDAQRLIIRCPFLFLMQDYIMLIIS